MSVTLEDALDALSSVARKCDVCEEHRATRRTADGDAVCDRDDCAHVALCHRCGATDEMPVPPYCALCGSTEVARAPRTLRWTDLPHAAALRAANVRRS